MLPSMCDLSELLNMVELSNMESFSCLISCNVQVQHLIKAIFSETPLRTECLKLIVERDFKEQDL